jgi:hypothetical protein
MIKKMMLLALAVGALVAFAAPAAQADELYEEESGALEVGAEVTATSTNLTQTWTGVGKTLTCQEVILHLGVDENGPESIHLSTLAATSIGCSAPFSKVTSGTITLGGGTGLATGWTFLASGVCDFAGNIPLSYATNSDVLNITGTSQLNGNCGPSDMTGSFTLTTGTGTPVYIS